MGQQPTHELANYPNRLRAPGRAPTPELSRFFPKNFQTIDFRLKQSNKKTGCAICGCVVACCSVPRFAAACCSLPQLAASCYSLPQLAAGCCSLPQLAATCCSLARLIAACCGLAQLVAACRTLQHLAAACRSLQQLAAACCSLPQLAASCCSLLRLAAACCSLHQFHTYQLSRIYTFFHAHSHTRTIITVLIIFEQWAANTFKYIFNIFSDCFQIVV